MILQNATAFIDGRFQKVNIHIQNGRFQSFYLSDDDLPSQSTWNVIDCQDKLILPGLIDIHTHGCIGYDFIHANATEIERMCEYYAKNGITSILPTTITMEMNTYKRAMVTLGTAINDNIKGSRILGVNMEGPFLGEEKKGAHDSNYLLPINIPIYQELNQLSGNQIKIINIDPTLPNAIDFIKNYKNSAVISLAHTSSSYETAMIAFEAGASHVTHLFNAMNGLHHREPGLIGAFLDHDIYGELICDGIHVHPSVIRFMFKVKADSLILISDSMSATGLEDGTYEIGGQAVRVLHKKATLKEGTIAGSTMNLYDCMKNAILYGVPPKEAILSASLIPAKSIHMDHELGSITIGKKADFIITNTNYYIESVYKEGKLI